MIKEHGARLAKILGDDYDIIGFDPRYAVATVHRFE
jgi:hypothetical protein